MIFIKYDDVIRAVEILNKHSHLGWNRWFCSIRGVDVAGSPPPGGHYPRLTYEEAIAAAAEDYVDRESADAALKEALKS